MPHEDDKQPAASIMQDDANRIRERIERYRFLLGYNRDPKARKVLVDLLREAEDQLKAIPKVSERDSGIS